ncbi:hypothetical protein Hokovirus_1_137 [Hokovirus HKV1]|uniref:Uncharacterized protein n=1 Tax=Hokovirus HKV1 TaxID=1977638 RepID=A0A1V0SF40_9VIRU|nr:hypothetical protein Hokovirus_1_137 [Hokovirus HKV1]
MILSQNFYNIYHLQKKKLINAILAYYTLLLITTILIISLLTLIIIRPYFWQHYNKIVFSPLIGPTKPNNDTIYALPCIIEITEYYTCNNDYYYKNITDLTCPNNYICNDYENNLYCVLKYCNILELEKSTQFTNDITDCINQTNDILNNNLYASITLTYQDDYTEILVIMILITIMLIILYFVILLINYIIFKCCIHYNDLIVHIILFVLISCIYFLTVPLTAFIFWYLMPPIQQYTKCFYMDTLLFSSDFPSVLTITFILTMLIFATLYILTIYTFVLSFYNYYKKKLFFEHSLDLELWL